MVGRATSRYAADVWGGDTIVANNPNVKPLSELGFGWLRRDRTADFEHWAKHAEWTSHQLLMLSLGCDPLQTDADSVAFAARGLDSAYAERRELVKSHQRRKRLRLFPTPHEAVDWLNAMELPFPEELSHAVSARPRHVELDAAQALAQAIAENEKLTADAAALRQQVDQLLADQGQALDVRERQSLLKLVIGMAAAGYRYDPKAQRSGVTGEIATDLERKGVGLSADTVLKYLREGSELLPPQDE